MIVRAPRPGPFLVWVYAEEGDTWVLTDMPPAPTYEIAESRCVECNVINPDGLYAVGGLFAPLHQRAVLR